ncbi:uncharacterized protein FIBRA_00553 [Fibroporia radiculosa]|uniref:PX domain-containing protein n=1 Tax=Fibroporia radiculosa TaxID=599839 RepID=J4G0E5_9APHY|nr:uncharacterized protein FIBRA_00553 [Fibroporia radiculosa]CCL98553.1 predicted protein [Fibroporia radiculosa]
METYLFDPGDLSDLMPSGSAVTPPTSTLYFCIRIRFDWAWASSIAMTSRMPSSPPRDSEQRRVPSSPSITHPFENAQGLLVILPDKIDVEEEARLYEELCDTPINIPPRRPASPVHAPSVFSRDIWLGDNSGESLAFAREVEVVGWTSVGDKRGGAYIVYDCAVKTKEGTVIHVHKRYSAFVELYTRLRTALPVSHGQLSLF